tara:strand:- start:142 stop:678 length:537 start_codon:yes stop_codon:yes gene_type:complete
MHDQMVSIAITGSPAVGKSALANLLETDGWNVESVADLAKQFACEGDYDEMMGCVEIDIHKLAENFNPKSHKNIVIDGHLSHFLEADAIVILRCEPTELRTRLEARGYGAAKINANVEWELIAGTWSEIAEFEISVPILELDSSILSSEEMVARVNSWVNSDFTTDLTTISNAIDWIS